jgi:ribonuclease P protein component
MTPSDQADQGTTAPVNPDPAVSSFVQPITLQKRADFLKAASARRQPMPGFLLQARARGDGTTAVRIGFTCSKKVGNSVLRNRARRRLREIARATLPSLAQPGWDYVLVGRPGVTAERPYVDLLADLAFALKRIHASDKGPAK